MYLLPLLHNQRETWNESEMREAQGITNDQRHDSKNSSQRLSAMLKGTIVEQVSDLPALHETKVHTFSFSMQNYSVLSIRAVIAGYGIQTRSKYSSEIL